jgi:hypothetical protein
MKTTIRLFVHQKPGEEQRLLTADMSDYPTLYGALLGYFETEVEWPEVDADPTAILVKQYEKELEREIADHRSRVHVINERINSLLCLTHDNSESPL